MVHAGKTSHRSRSTTSMSKHAATPEPVAACKTAIRAADALLIATPEYNHGVPGVL